ncbi:kinase domain-containing protein [Lophiotrema nucula]|uniref:non-specific serine/threonine protein kinase n=1 Tax=Lophiotrema nucula TaxID=690887 RepID=A0A6A5ZTD7_9PLEO|nr:kinase domain-containing protein [Lophiotrema nucula]
MASNPNDQPAAQGVRFSSHNEEIEPNAALEHVTTLTESGKDNKEALSPEAEEEIRNLAVTLQKSRCQAKRMENFSFEPVSLPPSRAPSPSPASRTPSVVSGHRTGNTPRPSPPASAMHSPPLTPAGTSSHDGKPSGTVEHRKGPSDPAMMTPQVSPPHEPPPTSMDSNVSDGRRPASVAVSRSPKQSPQASPRPASFSDVSGVVGAHPKHPPTFTVGPAGDSLPQSRDVSPSGSTGVNTPGHHTPGTSTPTFGRPFTPHGDKDDPYARSKRPPQPRNLDALDARFVFDNSNNRRSVNYSGSTAVPPSPLPRSRGSDGMAKQDKRSSFFGGSKHNAHTPNDDSDARSAVAKKEKDHHHGSMSELKRFFKLGGHKKDKRSQSPAAPSTKSDKPHKPKKSGTMTPPITHGSISVPFADDHGLESRYGKFGKVLGSGAGGSVRLLKRSSDNVTFAVKQFRARHAYESERDYSKKVTAEFCIGSTLHHGNIIETMDLVNEKGSYYVVMEYAPYDLFAIVMTGKMSREEVACCTLQILNGVSYLHSMGLAHRDLKLDNVVVNEHGIMKIIDFGSAAVFRYPFENDLVLASGIVGSDPYLAPEVYDMSKYDPQPTDIWSMAIIFCCMTLRRFPWKAPRVTDNSYKLFVSPPNDGPKSITNKSSTNLEPESASDDRRQSGPQSEPASRQPSDQSTATHHHHHHHRREGAHSEPVTNEGRAADQSTTNGQSKEQQPQVIKGPWRLLRLLPRESRHIIGRMLEVDPKQRATLEEILDDKWVKGAQVCSQEEGGKVLRCENHDHTLEPGAGASTPNTRQK